ncbi:MAG: class I SAM-dependent methyltransferase [Dechloromonas sp.]|nr:class I SAM-dependent methyltransferase [Dechloromonas sp.]
MPDSLQNALDQALQNRQPLLASLYAEHTDAYRLFHGSAENHPRLTVDRYGPLLLIQTFHQSLDHSQREQIEAFYADALPGLHAIYNDRSRSHSRVSNPLPEAQRGIADTRYQFSELGLRYHIQARHAGQDPWLFLDLRAGRRHIRQTVAGQSVLNLFAYTCGVGLAAAAGGAAHVVNVDFAESSLRIGKDNARLNDLAIRPRFIQSDAFAAMRQLAGIGQADRVRGKRMPPFPALAARQFDLVFLDPPRYAKSAFGVVDLINDYPALLKPAIGCTRPGGRLICCNNVAQVSRNDWEAQLLRSAEKNGRPVQSLHWITPESDFPSHDDQHPLKMVELVL